MPDVKTSAIAPDATPGLSDKLLGVDLGGPNTVLFTIDDLVDLLFENIRSTCKFSVYRNAAWTAPNAVLGKVAFDVERFDTGSNFDNSTNYRFTAPVAGFYQINWTAGSQVAANTIHQSVLYKNGSAFSVGSLQNQAGGTQLAASTGTELIQLAVGDYLEVYYQGSGGVGLVPYTKFSGFLQSLT